MNVDPHEERETRHIILLRLQRRNNLEILLSSKATRRTLPEVVIPRWQRPAEHLTTALRETCGVHAVSVSSLDVTLPELGSEQIRYEIMGLCSSDADIPREKEWVTVDSLLESTFRDPSDFQAVHQAIAQSATDTENTTRGPFASLGWFSELQRWVQTEIETFGLHLNGKFRQLNACATFSLIRFETDGPAVWFKAVGAPNQREYPLTLTLARLFSRFLPQILATRPEFNGWLAREAEGSLLSDCCTLQSWEAAAADLAELQIASLGRGLHLLDLGAHDLRTSALVDLVEPFFLAMGKLMERQTKIPPARLSVGEIRSLSRMIQDALTLLAETGIPTTIGHLDLNPGNVVCSTTGAVFLDWAETFVGHPFITFEYLLEHFRQTFGHEHRQETEFVARYTSPWSTFVSESDIRRALEVAPLVAVFAYAAGNNLWMDSSKLTEPHTAGYLRGLVRRMMREACSLAKRNISCPS